MASACSKIITSRPAIASSLAHAKPTTPAPMTTQSTFSGTVNSVFGCAQRVNLKTHQALTEGRSCFFDENFSKISTQFLKNEQ